MLHSAQLSFPVFRHFICSFPIVLKSKIPKYFDYLSLYLVFYDYNNHTYKKTLFSQVFGFLPCILPQLFHLSVWSVRFLHCHAVHHCFQYNFVVTAYFPSLSHPSPLLPLSEYFHLGLTLFCFFPFLLFLFVFYLQF